MSDKKEWALVPHPNGDHTLDELKAVLTNALIVKNMKCLALDLTERDQELFNAGRASILKGIPDVPSRAVQALRWFVRTGMRPPHQYHAGLRYLTYLSRKG